MKSEQTIRERLAELDGEHIPHERGGKCLVGKVVALKWVLDDSGVDIDSSGKTLDIKRSDDGTEEEYQLWRNAAFFDDEATHIDTLETRQEARDEMVRRAEYADLLCSDYEIREITDGDD